MRLLLLLLLLLLLRLLLLIRCDQKMCCQAGSRPIKTAEALLFAVVAAGSTEL